MKRFLFIVIIALMTSCNTREDNVVRVGVILPLSGNAASYGIECKNGIEMSNIKDSLGIEYIFEDSKGDPKTAIAAYKKLSSINHVDYILGDMFSSTTLAVAPLADKDEMILISPTASSREISKGSIYTLSVFPSEVYESKLIANFAIGKYQKIAVLYEKVAAAQVMYDSFTKEIGTQSKIIGIEFESNISDFRNMLFKVKNEDCDAVYLITYTNKAIQIISQSQEIDLQIDFLGQSALYDPTLFDVLKLSKNKFYLTGPSYHPSNTDSQSKEFASIYESVYGKQVNQMSAQGYIASIVAYELYNLKICEQYNKVNILKIERPFFGAVFKFDSDLSSLSGLRIYEYRNHNYEIVQ